MYGTIRKMSGVAVRGGILPILGRRQKAVGIYQTESAPPQLGVMAVLTEDAALTTEFSGRISSYSVAEDLRRAGAMSQEGLPTNRDRRTGEMPSLLLATQGEMS